MRPALLLISPFLAGLLLVAAWSLRKPVASPATPAVVSAPANPAASTILAPEPTPPRAGFSPEDVFRRAFWRHPTRADRVLHAERVEAANATGEVASWRWFIAVHPGPELLAALRSPETFGLRRVESTDLASSDSRPDWFPSAPADFEILRSPTGGLTVLYRAKDNLLYATDQGAGFAAPTRPL